MANRAHRGWRRWSIHRFDSLADENIKGIISQAIVGRFAIMAYLAAMTRKLKTRQEQVIHDLSTYMLGAHAVFAPDHYGPNAHEPADVAWVANRCAVLMYMTDSKGSFEKKKDHNLGQLRRWLRKWKAGERLNGQSANREWSFGWDEIDYVIGLSVIDGGEVSCQFHPEQVASGLDRKLAACATVTGKVMERMAKSGSGIRDVLDWLRILADHGPDRLDENALIGTIRAKDFTDSAEIRKEFDLEHFDADLMNDGWRTALHIFSIMRSAKEAADETDVLAHDFKAKDAIWLGVAYTWLASQMALPGEFGPLAGQAVRRVDGYTIRCIVFANLKVASENAKDLVLLEPGLSIALMLDFGIDNPHAFFTFNEIPPPTNLARELKAMRDAVIQSDGQTP